MFCRECGNKLNDDAKFCAMCGAPVKHFATSSEDKEQEEPTEQPNPIVESSEDSKDESDNTSKKKIAIIVCSIVIVVIVAIGSVFGVNAYKEKKAEEARIEAEKKAEEEEQKRIEQEEKEKKEAEEAAKKAEEEKKKAEENMLNAYRNKSASASNQYHYFMQINGDEVPYLITENAIYHYENGQALEVIGFDYPFADHHYYAIDYYPETNCLRRYLICDDMKIDNMFVNLNTMQVAQRIYCSVSHDLETGLEKYEGRNAVDGTDFTFYGEDFYSQFDYSMYMQGSAERIISVSPDANSNVGYKSVDTAYAEYKSKMGL